MGYAREDFVSKAFRGAPRETLLKLCEGPGVSHEFIMFIDAAMAVSEEKDGIEFVVDENGFRKVNGPAVDLISTKKGKRICVKF